MSMQSRTRWFTSDIRTLIAPQTRCSRYSMATEFPSRDLAAAPRVLHGVAQGGCDFPIPLYRVVRERARDSLQVREVSVISLTGREICLEVKEIWSYVSLGPGWRRPQQVYWEAERKFSRISSYFACRAISRLKCTCNIHSDICSSG